MVEVLRRLHRLGESQGPTLEARIKHMQRLGFPRKRGLGRGRRATYAFDEILKVATAFQLIETGMASALAVAMVANDWGVISQALARGLSGDAPLVVFCPQAFQASDGVHRPGAAALGTTRLQERNASIVGAGSLLSTTWVVLDPLAMVTAVRRAVIGLPGIPGDEFDGELRLLVQGTV